MEPDRVTPEILNNVRVEAGNAHAILRPASWNVIRLKAG
jgi:hypothetical protein